MPANLFSRLERFREECQVMAGYWFSENLQLPYTQKTARQYAHCQGKQRGNVRKELRPQEVLMTFSSVPDELLGCKQVKNSAINN